MIDYDYIVDGDHDDNDIDTTLNKTNTNTKGTCLRQYTFKEKTKLSTNTNQLLKPIGLPESWDTKTEEETVMFILRFRLF